MKPNANFQTILDAALEYAGFGWHVFPVPPGQKKSHKSAEHSAGRKWGASCDPAEIRRDWQHWPEANVGIVTGEKSGVLVIEADTLDGHNVDGIANLAALIKAHGDIPATIEAVSPSGSRHIYFKWPTGRTIRNSASQVAPGIDVRGEGGMVVAAPSVKPGKPNSYSWMNPPRLFDLADCPEWLLALCEKPEAKANPKTEGKGFDFNTGSAWADAAMRAELANLFAAPNGKRNEVLNAVAFALGQIVGFGLLDESDVRARLWGAAMTIGLEQAETEATINSGLIAGMQSPRGPKTQDGLSGAKADTSDKLPDLDLIKDIRGRTVWCAENACIVLEQSPAWAGVFAYDEFGGLTMLQKPLPGSTAPKSTYRPRPITDSDMTAVLRWFNRNGFPDGTRQTVTDAVDAVARANAFSPVQDYLHGLTWDGKPRAGAWLATYCGAAQSSLTDKQGQAWLISAVARALNPGCKADCALVLEGHQGAGKSSAISILAGVDWFFDGLHDLHSKDASAGLRGKWIIELPELSAMRRTETEGVKAFLSRTTERYRPAYGRCEVIEPRRCVFAGTTNRTDWLTDDTGGRRFWPVALGKVDLQALARDRNQIWAEAVSLYKSGAKWWLASEDEAGAAAVVALRSADDPWSADVLAIADGLAEVNTRDIFQLLDFPRERWGKAETMRVAGILARAGWTHAGKFTGGANRGLARYLPPTRGAK